MSLLGASTGAPQLWQPSAARSRSPFGRCYIYRGLDGSLKHATTPLPRHSIRSSLPIWHSSYCYCAKLLATGLLYSTSQPIGTITPKMAYLIRNSRSYQCGCKSDWTTVFYAIETAMTTEFLQTRLQIISVVSLKTLTTALFDVANLLSRF